MVVSALTSMRKYAYKRTRYLCIRKIRHKFENIVMENVRLNVSLIKAHSLKDIKIYGITDFYVKENLFKIYVRNS